MKNFIYIFSLLYFSMNGIGQNFVPNYSFESHTACPSGPSQLYQATPWISIPINEADYFNSCSSDPNFNVPFQGIYNYQAAKTGNAYIGILIIDSPGLSYREYAQIQLNSALPANVCYFVEFFTNRCSGSFGGKYAANNIACSFTNSGITTTGTGYVLNLTPHIIKFGNPIISDTLNWTKISGIFISNGGEDFLTIGNFSNDANTDTLNMFDGSYPAAYYFIDDVSVISIDSILGGMPAFAGNDTSVVLGDSVFIGQQITNLNCNWYDSTGIQIANTISGIYVHPPKSTYYIVEQNLCGTITYDTVHVTVLPVGINENDNQINFNLYPNPAAKNITIEFDLAEKENLFLEIKNVLGQTVKMINNKAFTKGSTKIEVDISGFSSGLYFVQLKSANNIITKKFIKE